MSDGTSWQLSAQLNPATPEPEVEDGTTAEELAPPPGWQQAAEGVRTSVKWMVTAFAAVGAVMFAKGFVSSPKLSWTDNTGQLAWAWVVGGLGLIGLGSLIYLATDLLRPTLFELSDLPGDYRTRVDANPEFYLPSDSANLAEFIEKLASLRAATQVSASELERLDTVLEEAKAANPPDQVTIDAAQAARDLQEYSHNYAKYALTIYKRTRQDLMDRAIYWQSSKGFNSSRFWMVGAAVLAAVGGIGYQLLLAVPDKPAPKDADKAAQPPAIGQLIKSGTPAGRRFWKQLDLGRCEPTSGTHKVPVVVASGTGTSDDPFVVSTITAGACPAISFRVIDEVARVTIPEPVAITYEPKPEKKH